MIVNHRPDPSYYIFMRLALFEPDIPQNAATLIRLGACLGVPVDVIEPCGFLFSEAGFRRAGLDYLDRAEIVRHPNWQAFREKAPGRLVLLTTKAALAYTETIVWDLPSEDALWQRLHEHFSEPELVELGYFVALTMGQQRWLRTLNIDHHQVLAGSSGSMAPGFETAEEAAKTRARADYWAKQPAPHARKNAAE